MSDLGFPLQGYCNSQKFIFMVKGTKNKKLTKVSKFSAFLKNNFEGWFAINYIQLCDINLNYCFEDKLSVIPSIYDLFTVTVYNFVQDKLELMAVCPWMTSSLLIVCASVKPFP